MTLAGVIYTDSESNMGLSESNRAFHLTDTDLHPHLQARMAQRGVTVQEIERALIDGWQATSREARDTGQGIHILL